MTAYEASESPLVLSKDNVRLDEVDFNPAELEDLCVHKIYDAIAEDFSSTRHSPWPGVVHFLQAQPMGAFGADIGCGNGKYLLAAVERLGMSHVSSQSERTSSFSSLAPILAVDRSVRLAQIVRERGFDVVVGDVLRLPYCADRLDFFLCIAVIHHLSTSERRLDAIRELARLLRPGGKGLIQVWAKEQHDPNSTKPAPYLRKNKSQSSSSTMTPEVVEPVPNVPLPIHISGTEFPASDMLVPWKRKASKKTQSSDDQVITNEPVHGRYYHLFVRGELEFLISRVSSLQLERAYYEKGNWAAIVVKLPQNDKPIS